MLSRVSRLLLVVIFLSETAFGQNLSGFTGSRGGAEFWVGKEQGKPLITVNLLNGVGTPGIYHVPIDTNIAQLIAYAGGTPQNAEIDAIEIRRSKTKDETEIIYLNYVSLSRKQGALPVLVDRDVIFIPVARNLERTLQYIGLVSGFLAIILSSIAIRDSTK